VNRRDLSREVAINANAYGRSAGEVSKGIQAVMDGDLDPFIRAYLSFKGKK
jgi:HAE1 family hydrophobic/amphiphilic exporter-1